MIAKGRIISVTIVLFALILASVFVVKCQTPAGTVVAVNPADNSAQVGKTFVVTITISNVQNLYGIDLTLDYNNSVLKLISAEPETGNIAASQGFLGSSSIPGGVLYGSPVTDNAANVNAGCVYYNTSLSTVDEYHLFASSVAPADSFNGSGTVASLTFSVLTAGHSDLTLNSTLADHPIPGETTSEAIDHTDVSASFGTSQIPEFPLTAAFALLVVAVTTIVLVTRKLHKKTVTPALQSTY
ncbi:MAG TPA: cohesin domain-containing protein [Candidatus Acidoferrales bacterium]|nr:cohesin domain-containing protein [Candidatus Acidoferrales bacterium]